MNRSQWLVVSAIYQAMPGRGHAMHGLTSPMDISNGNWNPAISCSLLETCLPTPVPPPEEVQARRSTGLTNDSCGEQPQGPAAFKKGAILYESHGRGQDRWAVYNRAIFDS